MEWQDLSYLFDVYDLFENENQLIINDWEINLSKRRLGIGTYQFYYLIYNSDKDTVVVRGSINNYFWDRFLNYGGFKFMQCNYLFPTMKKLKKSNNKKAIKILNDNAIEAQSLLLNLF